MTALLGGLTVAGCCIDLSGPDDHPEPPPPPPRLEFEVLVASSSVEVWVTSPDLCWQVSSPGRVGECRELTLKGCNEPACTRAFSLEHDGEVLDSFSERDLLLFVEEPPPEGEAASGQDGGEPAEDGRDPSNETVRRWDGRRAFLETEEPLPAGTELVVEGCGEPLRVPLPAPLALGEEPTYWLFSDDDPNRFWLEVRWPEASAIQTTYTRMEELALFPPFKESACHLQGTTGEINEFRPIFWPMYAISHALGEPDVLDTRVGLFRLYPAARSIFGPQTPLGPLWPLDPDEPAEEPRRVPIPPGTTPFVDWPWDLPDFTGGGAAGAPGN